MEKVQTQKTLDSSQEAVYTEKVGQDIDRGWAETSLLLESAPKAVASAPVCLTEHSQ